LVTTSSRTVPGDYRKLVGAAAGGASRSRSRSFVRHADEHLAIASRTAQAARRAGLYARVTAGRRRKRTRGAARIRHNCEVKRDRNVLYALACALTLLVALIFGLPRGSSSSHRGEDSIARGGSVPQALAAIAARTVRVRVVSPRVSPDCDRRAPAEHGTDGATPDALPPSSVDVDEAAWFEPASSLRRANARAARESAEAGRRSARAPPR